MKVTLKALVAPIVFAGAALLHAQSPQQFSPSVRAFIKVDAPVLVQRTHA